MMTKEGSTKIETFITPWAGVLALGRGFISHIVEMHFSYKNHPLYSQAWIEHTKYIHLVVMTKEGSTKIINFMTPGAGFFSNMGLAI